MTTPSIVVLGAGPVGLAAAVLLARDHGCTVTLYDRQTDLSQANEESYPIGLNPRALRTLEMVSPDLRRTLEGEGFIRGWSIHAGATGKRVAFLPSGTVVGSTRGRVVQALYAEAMRTAAAGHMLKIRLGYKLTTVDIAGGSLTFQKAVAVGECDEERQVTVDISHQNTRLLDCSGCWSKVRSAISNLDTSFEVDETPWNVHYRNLFSDEAPPPKTVVLDPKLHYVFNPAGIYAAILKERRWVFCLSVNESVRDREWLLEDGPASPEKIARLKEHIRSACPLAGPMLSEEEYCAFFARRAFTGQVVRVSRLNYAEKVVLLGDAAHALLPATGEGINAALEDVRVLLDCFSACYYNDTDGGTNQEYSQCDAVDAPTSRAAKHTWFTQYNVSRIADAQAISEYAKYALHGQQQAGCRERNRRFAEMILLRVGQKLGIFGASWGEKTFGTLATHMEAYSHILAHWKSQHRILLPISRAIVAIPNLFIRN